MRLNDATIIIIKGSKYLWDYVLSKIKIIRRRDKKKNKKIVQLHYNNNNQCNDG